STRARAAARPASRGAAGDRPRPSRPGRSPLRRSVKRRVGLLLPGARRAVARAVRRGLALGERPRLAAAALAGGLVLDDLLLQLRVQAVHPDEVGLADLGPEAHEAVGGLRVV